MKQPYKTLMNLNLSSAHLTIVTKYVWYHMYGSINLLPLHHVHVVTTKQRLESLDQILLFNCCFRSVPHTLLESRTAIVRDLKMCKYEIILYPVVRNLDF